MVPAPTSQPPRPVPPVPSARPAPPEADGREAPVEPTPRDTGPGPESPTRDDEAATRVFAMAPPEPARRPTGGSDRIFRGQRPVPGPTATPAVSHGPLPPPAPVPVPERVREAVSEPIGSPPDTAAVSAVLDDAVEMAFSTGAQVRRDEPLRARPVFRPDVIQSSGGRRTAPSPREVVSNGEARGGSRASQPAPASRNAPEPPAPPPTSSETSEKKDASSAMDTLATLYPPPSTDPPGPEKVRRRRLRRG